MRGNKNSSFVAPKGLICNPTPQQRKKKGGLQISAQRCLNTATNKNIPVLGGGGSCVLFLSRILLLTIKECYYF